MRDVNIEQIPGLTQTVGYVMYLKAQNDKLQREADQLRAELEAIRGQQPDAVSVPRELLERISLSRPYEPARYQAIDELRALLSTKNAEEV